MPELHPPGSVNSARSTGLARNELLFVIICSAAVVVAVLAVVGFFAGQRGTPFVGDWQCLNCEHTFSSNTQEMPPIACPECKGPAVRLIYSSCPNCRRKVAAQRISLTSQGQAQRKVLRSQYPQGPAQELYLMQVGMLPTESQYWVRSPEAGDGWTEWILAASPRTLQMRQEILCPKCGVRLQPPSPDRHR